MEEWAAIRRRSHEDLLGVATRGRSVGECACVSFLVWSFVDGDRCFGMDDVLDGVEGDECDLFAIVVRSVGEALKEHVPNLHRLTGERSSATVDGKVNVVRYHNREIRP